MMMIVVNRLVLLIVSILIVGLSCTRPPGQTAFTTDPSFYHPIDEQFDWERLRLGSDEIIPIEIVNGELCLLKEKYRRYGRDISDLNYAGVIFYAGSTGPSILGTHRLQGMTRNPQIIQTVVNLSRDLRNRPAPVRGMVILLDSLETISNAQLELLVRAPASCIMLNNLKYLGAGQARILAGYKGKSICLNGLLWLGAAPAKELAEFEGDYLSLNSIRVLDIKTAQALVGYAGKQLYLKELDGVSVDLFRTHSDSRTAQLVTTDR